MSTKQRKRDVERFDQWAETYEESRLQRAFFEPVYQATLALATKTVRQPASILDIGCGTGKLLRLLHNCWPDAQLIGVDPAEHMIEVAKRLTPAATFSVAMAEALPLPDSSVDLALSTSSFHHWQNQAAGVREIARVLRPDGYFILEDASFPDWLVHLLRMRRFHSPAQLQTLFTNAGLQVQTQQKIVWNRLLATVGKK